MIKSITKFFRGGPRTGRFICHIGPPKTATTAIQSALQKISGGPVRYLGTFQPRQGNSRNGIYAAIMELIRTDPSRESVDQIQDEIGRVLEGGTDLVLSEEMLLVSQDGASIEQKLKRLSQAIECFSCVVIVTLREPVAALKSLYSEIYFRQEVLPRISFEEFLASDQARVFDYPHLLETLRKCGFDNVRCFSLQKGQHRIKLASFTGFPEHGQFLQLISTNQTEEKFREQLDALVVPEELATHLRKGYAAVSEEVGLRRTGWAPRVRS